MTILTIELDKPVSMKPLEAVDAFRSQIIPIGEAVGACDLFNWSETKSPPIVYARPFKNRLRLIGISPEGADAVESILSLVQGIGEFVFDGVRHKIANAYVENQQYLPRSSNKKLFYKTGAPMLFFTGARRKVYEGIEKTYGRDEAKIKEYIKTYSLEMIREDIQKKLCDYYGERNYSFVEKIELEWVEYSMSLLPFHKDEKLTPGIKGVLKTNFFLPPFIGKKSGKGFGEILNIKGVKHVA